MECNRTLAGLLGWTEIVELGGALLGMPPVGDPQCRGQAMVPDWHGDWRDCGPLIAMFGIDIWCWSQRIGANDVSSMYCDHASPDAALRHAIVQASIEIIETIGIEHAALEDSTKETA
jgi:hypothetical protein